MITYSLAMFTALQKLGYNPYHTTEAMKRAKRDLPLWEESLLAKYKGIGRPWGREEFEKLYMGQYDVS